MPAISSRQDIAAPSAFNLGGSFSQPANTSFALGGGFSNQPSMTNMLQQILQMVLMEFLKQAFSTMGGVFSPNANPAVTGTTGNAGTGATGGTIGTAGNTGTAGGATGGYGSVGNNTGGTTPAGGTNTGTATNATPINNNTDFRQLNTQQRTNLSGLSDRERAVLHLWGRQMAAKGHQDGGIQLTVLEGAQQGGSNSVIINQAELDLVNELNAKDQAEFGGITGRNLDREYFKVFQKITGKDISQRYSNAPVRFATGPAKLPEQFAVDSPEWEAAMERQNGLSRFDNAVLRLWGHQPLFNGGKIDGSILAYTLESNNSLDRGMNKADVRSLLESDLAADGIVNGDSLETSFLDTMDRLYLGGPGASAEKTRNDALSKAASLGRTMQQIGRDTTQGVQDAISNVGQMMKDHPIMTGAAVGGMAAAAAICPFLTGLGVGAAGVGMAQNLIENKMGNKTQTA